MTSLHQYESWLDDDEARLRVEGEAVVCDLGEPFSAQLHDLLDAESVVQHARILEARVRPKARRPDFMVKEFVRLVNSKNGLNLPVDEIAWEAMLWYKREGGEQA